MEDTNNDVARFEADGKAYEVKYTIGRVDLYEDAHGSLGKLLWAGDVFLKHSQLVDLLSYGIREVGGDWVNPAQARTMADKLIEGSGYMDALTICLMRLKDDCGFLFRDSTI